MPRNHVLLFLMLIFSLFVPKLNLATVEKWHSCIKTPGHCEKFYLHNGGFSLRPRVFRLPLTPEDRGKLLFVDTYYCRVRVYQLDYGQRTALVPVAPGIYSLVSEKPIILVASANSMLRFKASIFRESDFLMWKQRVNYLRILLLAVHGLCFFAALMGYIFLRRKTFLFFGFFVITSFLSDLFVSGYAQKWFVNGMDAYFQLTFLLFFLVAVSIFLFSRSFLGYGVRNMRTVIFTAVLLVISLFSIFFSRNTGIWFFSVFPLCFVLYLFVIATIDFFRNKKPWIMLYILGWAFYLAGMLMTMALNWGFSQPSTLAAQGLTIGIILQLLFFLLALLRRYSWRQKTEMR